MENIMKKSGLMPRFFYACILFAAADFLQDVVHVLAEVPADRQDYASEAEEWAAEAQTVSAATEEQSAPWKKLPGWADFN